MITDIVVLAPTWANSFILSREATDEGFSKFKH